MKLFLHSTLISALALLLGYFIHQDSGYVLISYNHWTLETSLWLSILVLMSLYCSVYFLFRFISNGKSLPRKFQKRKAVKLQQKLHQNMLSGLQLFMEGRWQQAEKKFLNKIKQNPQPLINYLFCAQSAHHQQQNTQSQHYIEQLKETKTQYCSTATLTEISLLINNQQHKKALQLLEPLCSTPSAPPMALSFLSQVLLKCHQWSDLIHLLPRLTQTNACKAENINNLYYEATKGLLLNSSISSPHFKKTWKKIPREIKENENILLLYLQKQTATEGDLIYQTIEKALKTQWRPKLLSLIPQLQFKNRVNIITKVSQFEKKHGDCRQLLTCLCQLYHQESITGKTDYCIKILLQQFPCKQTYLTVAQIYQDQKKFELSSTFYQQAINCEQ